MTWTDAELDILADKIIRDRKRVLDDEVDATAKRLARKKQREAKVKDKDGGRCEE